MKLATLKTSGGERAALVIANEIIDLKGAGELIAGARLLPNNLRDILAGEGAALGLLRTISSEIQQDENLAAKLRQLGILTLYSQARLAAPIPSPGMILSCGTNYKEHAQEMGAKFPQAPGAFIKANSAIVGSGANIILPTSHPDWVDYEGEFSFVIGRPCHDVDERHAMDYVVGYTLVNDISARDWARLMAQAKDDFTEMNRLRYYNIHGKNFPTFCPIGPVIVTKDEIPDPHDVTFETYLNDEKMQVGRTTNLIFSIPWLLAEFSKFYQFQVGDVITTGSPPGVGLTRTPPRLLRHGDRIEIRCPEIGVLVNVIRASNPREP